MKVNTVELKNYRNYTNQKVSFQNGINVILGKNAQGKTNLLESIYLCTIGKSPRTNKDKDLILWGKEQSKISLAVSKKSGNKKIDIYLSTHQNKSIQINGIPITRMGQLLGEFNSVYFSPDELKLVKESPEERRRFMDIDLSQFNKTYFYTLNKYNKILLQRNKLLKTTPQKQVLSDTISIWNEQLATCGAYIIAKRLELIEKLKPHAAAVLQELTDQKEQLVLQYLGMEQTDPVAIKKELLAQYEKTLEKDRLMGFTTIGPHRDDFKISVNDIDIRHFGSQGQQRTCALALKLAELEVFCDQLGEYPVLLLDDVLSELDEARQVKLLQKISKVQTLLTTTQFSFNIPHTTYEVTDGMIEMKK